jgi:hypothetical protein
MATGHVWTVLVLGAGAFSASLSHANARAFGQLKLEKGRVCPAVDHIKAGVQAGHGSGSRVELEALDVVDDLRLGAHHRVVVIFWIAR